MLVAEYLFVKYNCIYMLHIHLHNIYIYICCEYICGEYTCANCFAVFVVSTYGTAHIHIYIQLPQPAQQDQPPGQHLAGRQSRQRSAPSVS